MRKKCDYALGKKVHLHSTYSVRAAKCYSSKTQSVATHESWEIFGQSKYFRWRASETTSKSIGQANENSLVSLANTVAKRKSKLSVKGVGNERETLMLNRHRVLILSGIYSTQPSTLANFVGFLCVHVKISLILSIKLNDSAGKYEKEIV